MCGQVLNKDAEYTEVGTAGELSNQIKLLLDENWTLSEDITITAIVRGVTQTQESEVQENE